MQLLIILLSFYLSFGCTILSQLLMISTLVVVQVVRMHGYFPTNITCFRYSNFDWARKWYRQSVLFECLGSLPCHNFGVLGIVLRNDLVGNLWKDFTWEFWKKYVVGNLWKDFTWWYWKILLGKFLKIFLGVLQNFQLGIFENFLGNFWKKTLFGKFLKIFLGIFGKNLFGKYLKIF